MKTYQESILDAELPQGEHLVTLIATKGNTSISCLALIRVGKKNVVECFTQPEEGDMYASWLRLKGNEHSIASKVYVWPAKDPEVMRMFEGDPVATIKLEK